MSVLLLTVAVAGLVLYREPIFVFLVVALGVLVTAYEVADAVMTSLVKAVGGLPVLFAFVLGVVALWKVENLTAKVKAVEERFDEKVEELEDRLDGKVEELEDRLDEESGEPDP